MKRKMYHCEGLFVIYFVQFNHNNRGFDPKTLA
jgi:hypothetical protein